MRRLSLRWRVAAAFGVGLALVMTVLAVATWNLTTGYMLDQREQSVTRQSEVNVRLVDAALADDSEGLEELLTGLATGPDSSILLSRPAGWLTSGRQVDPAIVPAGLLDQARNGVAARQRFFASGIPVLGVATPVGGDRSIYVELYPLVELDRAFRYLSTLLITGTVVAALFGVGLGAWAARRALRPLTALTAAASRVARGDLSARLPEQADPDLAPLAASFNTTAGQLEQRVRRDARFASDVSHELRSPLTTLATTVGVLASRRDELPERSRAALDLLTADVDRFQRLVEDLLEISRYDAGVADLHLEDVSLTELVTRAVASVDGPPVEFGPGARQDGLAIEADKRRMTQVIKNLVENAARYGGGATRVIVDAGHYVARVAVDDEGPGVAPEEREAIFERFFRGSASGQRRGGGQGSGLGLSLVTEHVRLHGGRVWVEDNPVGVGARFVVEIPLGRPE
jgi:two-component system sensor histidine kinase MtrB